MTDRTYFRTSTRETTDGLLENFRLGMLPANQAVREEFGVRGEDDARLFDAIKWAYDNGHLTREKLLGLKEDGRGLTEAVNVEGNPYSPVVYETVRDVLRADEKKPRMVNDEQ